MMAGGRMSANIPSCGQTNSKPFIYKFKTKSGYYIYDINTNNILKVNEILYDLIEEFEFDNDNKIVKKSQVIYIPLFPFLVGIKKWRINF